MKKIEKQLRQSRQNGIPGLQPPAGGWEAINARINDNPANVSTTATPNTGKGFVANLSWVSWLVSFVGLVLLGGLLVSLITDPSPVENTALATVAPATTTEQAAARPAGETTATLAQPQEPSTSVAAAEETAEVAPVPPKTNVDGPLSPAKPETPKAARNRPGILANKPANATTEEGTENKLPTANAPVTDKADGPVGDKLATAPSPRAAGTPNPPVAPNEGGITVLPPADQALTKLPAGEGATSAALAVTELPFSMSSLSVPAAEFGALPAIIVGPAPERNRNGKLRARPEFQVSAGLSGHHLRGFNNSRFYSRDVTTGGADRLFVLPSGEALPVRFNRSDLNNNLRRSIRFDVGINRQFSSGFLARAKLGVYYATNDRASDDFEQVTGSLVREDYYERRFIAPLELGFQYTFRKRFRFRPYLGVNYVLYVANNSVQRTTFFDAQTQSQGLIGQFESRGVSFADRDFSLTAGFQYKLTDKISAGLSLYVHSQSAYFIESPFGLEVRYSLK